MSQFLPRVWFVIAAAMFLACGPAFAVEPTSGATPLPAFQTDMAQVGLMQARYEQHMRKIGRYVLVAAVLSLFGAGCAAWAYANCRSVSLWFALGFVLNAAALLLILLVRHRNRGRRRYRRVISYWYLSR